MMIELRGKKSKKVAIGVSVKANIKQDRLIALLESMIITAHIIRENPIDTLEWHIESVFYSKIAEGLAWEESDEKRKTLYSFDVTWEGED